MMSMVNQYYPFDEAYKSANGLEPIIYPGSYPANYRYRLRDPVPGAGYYSFDPMKLISVMTDLPGCTIKEISLVTTNMMMYGVTTPLMDYDETKGVFLSPSTDNRVASIAFAPPVSEVKISLEIPIADMFLNISFVTWNNN